MNNFPIASDEEMERLFQESGITHSEQFASSRGSFSSGNVAIAEPPAPNLSSASDDPERQPIDIDNPADFHETFWPGFTLFPWQRATLLQFAGFTEGNELGEHILPTKEAPVEYSLVAANGSGKSALISARFALWYISHARDNICVVTSNTFEQLKKQTFRAIHRAADDVNTLLGFEYFECTECRVYCKATRGVIEGVATDRPGRAEGYHPDNTGQLAFIADEAKSISDELFAAFSRYHGYNTWIEVSSPAFMSGHFYERTMRAEQWAVEYTGVNDKLVLGRTFARRVTAFECPGAIPLHAINKIRDEDGEDGYLYKTSILAEFGSIGDCVVIPAEYTVYPAPAWNTYNLPLKAGLDISLGGDETVLSIWHGNKRIAQEIWHIADPKKLLATLINAFKSYGLDPANIAADGGGIGKVIIPLLRDNGWNVVAVNNESAAINKREHLNRGMELYWKLLRLIEARVLILPKEDKVLMKQLTSRKFEVRNGKQKLQSKQELSESPDRADAMALAFATVNLAEILLLHKKLVGEVSAVVKVDATSLPKPTLEQLTAFIDKRRADEMSSGRTQIVGVARFSSRFSNVNTPLNKFISPRNKRYA